jgi:hypothetical protein
MKTWMVAATVAVVLVVAGVPAGLALASNDTATAAGHSAASSTVTPRAHASGRAKAKHHGLDLWRRNGIHQRRHHGWLNGWRHGRHHGWLHGGPGRFGHRRTLAELTPQRRDRIADRLDRRAERLQKLATCLRSDAKPATCLARAARQQHGGRAG